MKLVLKDQEILHKTYRQTKYVLVRPLSFIFLGLTLTWYFGLQYDITESFPSLLWLITTVFGAFAIRDLILWYNNQYIFTNERLVRVSYHEIFRYTVMESSLDRILNVAFKTTGILSVMGHFGDVEVQAAGMLEPIVLKHINRPDEVKDYIWTLHGRHPKSDKLSPLELSNLTNQRKPKVEKMIFK